VPLGTGTDMDSMPPVPTARTSRGTQGVLQLVRAWRTGVDAIARAVAPLLDLYIRLWLAQAFFVSGLLKVANWDTALALARYEYPVSWLDPVTAAYTGAAVELVAPLLLAFGLATRAAALALLVLSLVIQFNYQALDTHLLWAALFGWLVLRGAGAISLDRLLVNGLADSALPFAAALKRSCDWITRHLEPLYRLVLRGWLAAALLAAAGGGMPQDVQSTLIVDTASALPPLLCTTAAALLLAGLLLRPATLVLLLTVAGVIMLQAANADSVHLLILLLASLALAGAGRWSLDAALWYLLRRRWPVLAGELGFDLARAPRVVIVGAGFGGLACAQGLQHAPVAVTLIDRHNYHLFQPLLYQLATTALAAGDIAMPVRALLREQDNACVLLGEVTGVDSARREVLLGARRIPYDYLVLATGATHSYFGRDEWAPYAPGLKRIEDATDVRSRLLLAFERAELAESAAERTALLTFLVVGAGPTGVELAGAIAELARFGMAKEFRTLDPAQARVILVQAGPRILPTFPERLSARAAAALAHLGVEILTDSRVEHIDAEGVRVSGTPIIARTVFWAAGVTASPAARWLGADADNSGRVRVGEDLSVPGMPGIFVIGDTAASNAWQGKPVPGIGPAAKQGGQYVARRIRARLAGKSIAPFRYRHLGSLATIGRKAAVADFGIVQLSGSLAWWLWGFVHVYFLAGMRNRISVMLDWAWAYVTFRSSTRLIADAPPPPATTTTASGATLKVHHGRP